jgi:L-galactono-1,4-lactone dehydrogenase
MRRHDALLSALRRGAGVALAPEAVGSRGMTSFVAATAARASCVPRAARPALPHDRHLSRSLSPAHRRWYATGRAGASGSFAVPHPTRADTLRYPARAAGAAAALDPKLKGAMVGRPDPLASRGEGGPGGGRATAFDRLVYYPILFLAAVEALVWYSVAATAPPSEQQTVENWSATKRVPCERFVQPETPAAVRAAVEWAHVHRKRLRPVGSALSPNGAAFNEDGMISLALLDEVLEIDEENMTVTTQAGARVAEVTERLRERGLTLVNYASIREQQIGGFTQVGAHGTGATVPPLDETVCKLKLVTPAKGEVTLSLTDPDGGNALRVARCGVGALGVATEVTMRVAKAHRLVEKTWTASRADVRKNHKRWLADHQHIRYMWIPHTDCVVVVGSNPLAEGADAPRSAEDSPERARRKTEPMRRLLKQCAPEVDGADMGFGQLRDELLKVAPLDLEHVKRVNAAEAEFWRRNSGQRCDWSDRILGFDCGGQQHVYEVAFRTGDSVETNTGADLEYMAELLEMIEREGIPAPAPIEQRWSAGSASPLSPATNVRPDGALAPGPGLHSWIGIIMYLPGDDADERNAITAAFEAYAARETEALGEKFQIRTHWAKIELPGDPEARVAARRAVESRYDVSGFRELRASYDPKGVLGNDMIEGLMGDPARVEKRDAFSRAFWGPLEAYAEERARETAQDKSPGQKAEAETVSFHRRLERDFNRAVEEGSVLNVCARVASAVATHAALAYRNARRALEAEDARRAEAKREAESRADERLARPAPPAADA